jgi:hypothetical protein
MAAERTDPGACRLGPSGLPTRGSDTMEGYRRLDRLPVNAYNAVHSPPSAPEEAMGWWTAFKTRRAIKKYARKMPGWLNRSYGGSEWYTTGQIETAAAALKLDPAALVFGYAAFLPEATFNALQGEIPSEFSYQDARDKFFRHVPRRPYSASGNSPVNFADGGDSGGAHPGWSGGWDS